MKKTILPLLVAVGLVGSASAQLVTNNFNYTGYYQSFLVPNGVTSILFELVGASGGDSGSGGAYNCYGGTGATVSGQLTVFSGEIIWIGVGGAGLNPSQMNYNNGNYQGGGWNGGGGGYQRFYSGGGGGATDIFASSTGWSNLLAIAGGGGGQQDKVLAVGVDWAFLRVEPFMIIITGFVNITSLMEIMDNMVVAVADTGEDLQNREGVVGSIHQ